MKVRFGLQHDRSKSLWQSSVQGRRIAIVSLYFAAAIAALCGVAYELLLAAYATFLMGASVFQYSLVISLMMASMGIGSLLANKIPVSPLSAFLTTELVLGFSSLISIPLLYYVFSIDFLPYVPLVSFVVVIGLAIGMEIPLLYELGGRLSGLPRVLFFDYLGGFAGGIVFPLVLVPRLDFFQIAAVLGMLNVSAGLLCLIVFRSEMKPRFFIWLPVTLLLLILGTCYLFLAHPLRIAMERHLFDIHQ